MAEHIQPRPAALILGLSAARACQLPGSGLPATHGSGHPVASHSARSKIQVRSRSRTPPFKRFHYDSHDQLRQQLADLVAAYNFARRLKTLRGLTPYEAICKAWVDEPSRAVTDQIESFRVRRGGDVIRCAALRGGEPMASALSVDLRKRVVAAIVAGASRREAARRFEVSPASAVRWHGTFVQEGRTHAKPMGGDQRSHTIEAQADLIRQTTKRSPSCSCMSCATVWPNRVCGLGSAACPASSSATAITRKKNTGHAAEQEREDVKAARLSWFDGQLDLDPDKLVFLDETATNTKMVRRYGRAPARRTLPGRGAVRPLENYHGHCRSAHQRPDSHRTLRWTDDRRSLPWLCRTNPRPSLRPGDTVVLDNLPVHKVRGIRECIEAAGARLLYLPAIPPPSTRLNAPSPSSRPFFVPRLLARSATSGTLSDEPSDASRQPNAPLSRRRRLRRI